ncbi:MAG: response regulator [Nitrospirae bacterium]|nr:response regulator [Nitrospirota bacterium]MBF0553289.1 response regulator [Nitrospirota bacterium]
MRDESILKTLTVLYVEDDVNIRKMTSRFLKRRFAYVYEAENGKEGLRIYTLNKADIHLLITDIQMPIMSGMVMIEEIMKIDDALPIIITTAYNDEYHTSIKVCRNIIKPIDDEQLLESIISCVTNRHGFQ